MEIEVERSGFQELLASLYLRLNGYMNSGFIVHAPQNNFTEIDVIGVRFRHNSEPEREVNPSAWLQIPESSIDIVIGEVKGGDAPVQFNSSLRENQEAVASVLRWIGVLDEGQISETAIELSSVLSPRKIESPETFKSITLSSSISDSITIRGLLFAPDRLIPGRNQPRYIHGQEMLDFIWTCFCPEMKRKSCDTRYDLNLWSIYQPIVSYFKDRERLGITQGTMQEMYNHFDIHH